MELISHHQREEFGKGQKETPHVSPLPRIPLANIHFVWVMRAPPGETLNKNDWPKTTQKLIPISLKPKTASQVAEQFCVPLPYCSPYGCPFPLKSLALSAHVFPQTICFWVLDKSPVSGPGRGPLPATNGNSGGTLLPWDWHPDLSGSSGASLPANGPDPAAATGTLLSLVSSWHRQLARMPRQERNKRLYWPLSPSHCLSSP